MNREWSKRVIGASGAIFLFVGVWWLASLILQKTLLPSPWTVFVNIPSLFQKEMGLHIQVSGYRIFLGMLYALSGGFILGLLIGSLPKWRYFFDPLIYLTYPIPKMALLPIVMLLG